MAKSKQVAGFFSWLLVEFGVPNVVESKVPGFRPKIPGVGDAIRVLLGICSISFI